MEPVRQRHFCARIGVPPTVLHLSRHGSAISTKQTSKEAASTEADTDDEDVYLDEDVVQPGHEGERSRVMHDFGSVPAELYIDSIDFTGTDGDDATSREFNDDLTSTQ
jgi:hypothetical protein